MPQLLSRIRISSGSARYREVLVKEAECEANRAGDEASCKELETLREHLFRMTEDDIDSESDRLEEMKLPKRRFVATSDYIGTETVDGMYYNYSFTDFMSHSLYNYNKFIGILREMNYYYIHGTNVENRLEKFEVRAQRNGA